VGRSGAFKDRPLWRRLQIIHHEIKEGRHPNTSSLSSQLSVSSKTVQRDWLVARAWLHEQLSGNGHDT
jgi:transcriptional antiterminator